MRSVVNFAKTMWSVAKCKRVVRPVLARIHSLNELSARFPAVLEFDAALFEAHYDGDASLALLKPYISAELLAAYRDILPLLRALFAALDEPLALSRVCCYQIGLAMAWELQLSYYKLNLRLLFDGARGRDDIDAWLEAPVLARYRRPLLAGYVVHLVVMHLAVLYALVPAVVRCLAADGLAVGRTLMHEFWHHPHPPLFWAFHRRGVWRRVLGVLPREYAALVLDVYKKVPPLDWRGVLAAAAGVQHRHANLALADVLAWEISQLRAHVRGSASAHDVAHALKRHLARLVAFCRLWLCSRPLLFDSLVAHNDALFAALARATRFCIATAARAGLETALFEALAGAVEVWRAYFLGELPGAVPRPRRAGHLVAQCMLERDDLRAWAYDIGLDEVAAAL